ncbi:hypothetical protein Tco_0434548, partial [Tanacetum coccineum]
MYKLDLEPLSPLLRKNRDAHLDYLKETKKNADILCDILEEARDLSPLNNNLGHACNYVQHIQELLVYVGATCPDSKTKSLLRAIKKKVWKPTGTVFTNAGYRWIPTGRTFTIDGNTFPLTRITSTTVVPPKQLFPAKVVKKIPPSSNNLGEPKQSNVGRLNCPLVYYVEELGHNLFSVGQFCDSDLEVAFRRHTCFVRDLKGVDLLKGSRGTYLYTMSLEEMM